MLVCEESTVLGLHVCVNKKQYVQVSPTLYKKSPGSLCTPWGFLLYKLYFTQKKQPYPRFQAKALVVDMC